MSWNDKLVCRILLIIAGMVADDALKAELKSLAAHISVGEWTR